MEQKWERTSTKKFYKVDNLYGYRHTYIQSADLVGPAVNCTIRQSTVTNFSSDQLNFIPCRSKFAKQIIFGVVM